MQPTDRLHSLDAVRASALLLGIALHAASPWMAGLGWVAQETPNDVLGGVWYVIHIFRMPAFFLIAGFFGRMMLERRGARAFIKDRAKRIVVPLLGGWPITILLFAVFWLLGAVVTRFDISAYIAEASEEAASSSANASDGLSWMHLWFLYYLVIFYVCALAARAVFDHVIDRGGHLRRGLDVAARFVMGGVWGPVILAAPLAATFILLRADWVSWWGIYPPVGLIPEPTAMVGHGTAFALGWLLHRQTRVLLDLDKSWAIHGVLAVALTVVCARIAGLTPQHEPHLEGRALVVYAAAYAAACWFWIFALVGAAERFLSNPSPIRRYLADSSYWLYLLHLPVLVFVGMVFQALAWRWSVEYALTLAVTVPILLLSYHTMVRFTWLGALLNGRRHPRPQPPKLEGTPATS